MATKTENPPAAAMAKATITDTTVCTVPQLRGLFDSALPQIRKALPGVLQKNAERMARCALTEFQRNPEIAQCTGLSILSCAIQAAQLGLEVGGPTGQSYMVPFKNSKKGGVKEAQFQIGYRGMITLAFRSGEVSNIYASLIRENDKFEIMRGTTPGIDHRPALKNAGPVVGVYAVVVYKTGSPNFEVMSKDEIEHHRRTYSKQPDSLLWTKAWDEGAKKTVLRRLLKHCPLAVDWPVQAFDGGESDDAGAEIIEVESVTTPALPEPPADRGDAYKGDPDPATDLFDNKPATVPVH